MSDPKPQPRWGAVADEPFPGVRLGPDGAFDLDGGPARRYRRADGVADITVGAALVNKEPGNYAPLVIDEAGRRVLLMYRLGRWRQSPPIGEAGEELIFVKPSTPFVRTRFDPGPALAFTPPPAGRAAGSPTRTAAPTVAPDRPAEPAPTRRVRRPALWAVAAILALMAGVSAPSLGKSPPTGLVFEQSAWRGGAYYTALTHSLVHTDALWLAYASLGVVVFGAVVARRVGPLRATLVFLGSGAASLGVWQLATTETGQDIYFRYLGKLIEWAAERVGPEAAFRGALLVNEGWQGIIHLSGSAWGAAGALAGLAAFAVARRGPSGGRPLVRRVVLSAVALAYAAGALALRECFRPDAVAPYVLVFGGALAGLIFVFPDRFLGEVADYAKDRAVKAVWRQITGGSEKRRAA